MLIQLPNYSKGPFINYVYKVVQKCPLFVNVHMVENVNRGG